MAHHMMRHFHNYRRYPAENKIFSKTDVHERHENHEQNHYNKKDPGLTRSVQ